MEYQASVKRQTDSACRMLAFLAESTGGSYRAFTGLSTGEVAGFPSLSPSTLATRRCACGRIDLDLFQQV